MRIKSSPPTPRASSSSPGASRAVRKITGVSALCRQVDVHQDEVTGRGVYRQAAVGAGNVISSVRMASSSSTIKILFIFHLSPGNPAGTEMG